MPEKVQKLEIEISGIKAKKIILENLANHLDEYANKGKTLTPTDMKAAANELRKEAEKLMNGDEVEIGCGSWKAPELTILEDAITYFNRWMESEDALNQNINNESIKRERDCMRDAFTALMKSYIRRDRG